MTAVHGRERALLGLLLLGLAGLVAGGSAWSAFSATTTNDGNQFATGTVVIGDNDGGSMMYQVTGQAPGHAVERCITVAYTGTVDASVRLFASPVGALADHLALTITAGSLPVGTAYPDCTGFTAATTVFDSTLGGFAGARTDWATGLPVTPAGQASWSNGSTVVYRFRLTLAATAPQGASTGEHAFTWEARSL
jgi:predicted ribosomally synthesized peptide with SipW-like signal peptide